MSEQTKNALDQAIAAHIEDESDTSNSVVTGYALIVAHSTMEDFDKDVTRYLADYAEKQPFHVGLGLVHRHLLMLKNQCRED